MVRAGGRKKQLKRQILDFEAECGGQQKPTETNDPLIPQQSQINSLVQRCQVSWKGDYICQSCGFGTR